MDKAGKDRPGIYTVAEGSFSIKDGKEGFTLKLNSQEVPYITGYSLKSNGPCGFIDVTLQLSIPCSAINYEADF